MSREMRALFANAASDEANFLLVDSRFADFYMAVLAAKLAQELDASPLCSDLPSHEVNLTTFVDQVASPRATDATGALVTIAMKSLNVDPQTPIKELISFRRKRETQLAELSGKFRELSDTIEHCETAKQLVAEAQRVYDVKVRPGLEKLKDELQDNGIGSAWGGFKQTALLTVGAGSVAGMATGWSAQAILGTGAFITVADVAVQAYLAQRKVRRASPYTYLLDVHSKLHVPRHLLS
ncbi:hypothetical protein CK214_08550 [Mesorhizobium sp. WSM3882]|nr:hypothetical protein CK214_08550 [Mesorhizobium sp. WSM3882]